MIIKYIGKMAGYYWKRLLPRHPGKWTQVQKQLYGWNCKLGIAFF